MIYYNFLLKVKWEDTDQQSQETNQTSKKKMLKSKTRLDLLSWLSTIHKLSTWTSLTLTTTSNSLVELKHALLLLLEEVLLSLTSWLHKKQDHITGTLTFIKAWEDLLSVLSSEEPSDTWNSVIDKSSTMLGLLRDLEEDIQNPNHWMPLISGNSRVSKHPTISINGDENHTFRMIIRMKFTSSYLKVKQLKISKFYH